MDVSSTERKSWSPGESKRGMECRICGCKHFRLVYARPYHSGRIMRRRECRLCGRRMTTLEKAGR